MKDKRLIVLYILMLIVGVALLFTKSTSTKETTEVVAQPQVEVKEQPVEKFKKVTIAMTRRDIAEKTILTTDDYYFKTIDIDINQEEPLDLITNANELDSYVAKSHIQADTYLKHSLLASPKSPEYVQLSLKDGAYMFPFQLSKADNYLLKNLKSGDLVDIYVYYGAETSANKNGKEDKFVSPSRDFMTSRIKPIIVGKKIIFLETTENPTIQDVGQIQIELSNQEIKLVRTLMTNASVMLYPSNYKENFADGLHLLSDKEKNWPVSDKNIFSPTQINKLRGN